MTVSSSPLSFDTQRSSLKSNPWSSERFAVVLQRMQRDERQLQQSIKQARRAQWDAASLIAVQRGVYRSAFNLDVASKLIEGGARSLRQLLQANG